MIGMQHQDFLLPVASVLISASMTSISGAPRPTPRLGCDSPGQVHLFNLCPGKYEIPSGDDWLGVIPESQESYEYGHIPR